MVQLGRIGRNNRPDNPRLRRATIAGMDGILRWTGHHSWDGWLHGYHVHVGKLSYGWFVWLAPRGEWTEACLRADSFGHAAWLARAWIEKRGDKRLRKQK